MVGNEPLSPSLPEFVLHSGALATLPTGAVVRSEDTAPRGADGVPSELCGPIKRGLLGPASPPPHKIITGQELSEPSACYQVHRDWCKADPRSLRGLLVSSFPHGRGCPHVRTTSSQRTECVCLSVRLSFSPRAVAFSVFYNAPKLLARFN